MNKKYKDLFQLVEESPSAHSLYKSLPDYVKDSILERADNIQTEDALCRYADNLLSGDH